ncbi:hypothetical protein Tco_0801415 [Tanacetum coccineum]|uniref:CCHC-type domain-containing protein n=1 Tax=Tanacetum coccineum TaxID=301880 RepID=A0ABQ4ZZD4_9ASTR
MSQPANDEFSQHLSDDEESNHEDALDTGAAPKQQQQVIPQTTAISNIKLPILKKEEYDIWAMEMEHYLEYIDNEALEVIRNGKLQEENFKWERDEHYVEDFMEWNDAIRSGKPSETRFGGNANSKKMQKEKKEKLFSNNNLWRQLVQLDNDYETKQRVVTLSMMICSINLRFFGAGKAKVTQKPKISDSDDNSTEHSTCQSNDSEGSCGNTSEHSSESESESISVPNEMSTSRSVITNEKVVSELQEVEPSCAKHVKTPRQQMKDQATPKVNRKNWNAMMEREQGEGYSFTKKKCFVCGSLSHLIKDCDYYEKKNRPREAEGLRIKGGFNTSNGVAKPVWTNANRVNHSNKFVPRSVQLNAGRPNTNSVRPNINTGRTNINSVRPRVNAVSSNVNTVRSR